ncbi:DUF7937 domain-containing protein [Corynebacterium sp. A21]|uniref:DUF7937 domain-containing protein n=1 Tax=Corynebacterium sp. A21 TaxID=3457318 RepID=UPI003FD5FC40
MAKSSTAPAGFRVPLPLRVGGAFMALALVLFIFLMIEWLTTGFFAPFAVTPRFVVIVLAALILGAFATMSRNQESSRTQVIALAVAMVLVILSRFLPNEAIAEMAQEWLLGYVILALICALVIRRSMTPKTPAKNPKKK